MRPTGLLLSWGIAAAIAAACLSIASPVEPPLTALAYDLGFDGDRAHDLVREFVTAHPDRHSGAPNNERAAAWIAEFMIELDLDVTIEPFSAVLYGEHTPLRNVIAVLPGRQRESIVFFSHHDQAPTTVYGADNDGSGVGIMCHLAELFSTRDNSYTLVFVSTDAEEYGMLGSRQYVRSHPDPGSIVAAFSLDNVGREGGHGIHMAAIGQGRGYTPLWLASLVPRVAETAGTWVPEFPAPLFQALEQAVLISFTDQGPALAAGIPAVGFGVNVDSWPYYHRPTDTIDRISPDTLAHVGRLSEALVLELETREPGPGPDSLSRYIYRPGRGTATGEWAIRLAFLALLLPIGAAVAAVRHQLGDPGPHLARIALYSAPGLAAWAVVRALTAANVFPRFEFYPATPLDAVLYQPVWAGLLLVTAITVMTGLAVRKAVRRIPSVDGAGRAWGLLTVAAISLAVWVRNPFAVMFIIPAVWLWPLIDGGMVRRHIVLVGGGATVYLLLAFYGMMIELGPFIVWYLVLMAGTGMIAPYTMTAALVSLGAGLSLVASAGVHVTSGRRSGFDRR